MAQETQLGNNLIVTIIIGNFVLDEDSTSEITQSMVLDLPGSIVAREPELKFNMVEYVVNEIIKGMRADIVKINSLERETD